MASRYRCSADNCMNHRFKYSEFTFHPFPKEPDIREQWLVAMGKPDWVPPPYSMLCSAHFTGDSFQEILGLSCLKSRAVPSLFNPSGSKSLAKGLIKKSSPVRPRGILRAKGSPRTMNVPASLKVKSDQYLFPMKVLEQKETAVIDITGENPDHVQIMEDVELVDVEMTDSTPRSVKCRRSRPKVVPRSEPYLSEYLLRRNACVQTENQHFTETANTQTETSISTSNDDLGNSFSLTWEVDALKAKIEKLASHIHLLENGLRQKETEVELLLGQRNELSSRLNKETMNVVEHAFKEILQGFLNDDHSSVQDILTKSSQLCLNTNISFVKSVGNSDEKEK